MNDKPIKVKCPKCGEEKELLPYHALKWKITHMCGGA